MNILERKRTEAEILAVLGGVNEENPIWKTMLLILESQETQEHAAALQPGLTSEARAYNAGRDAALLDFKHQLGRLWLKAREVK